MRVLVTGGRDFNDRSLLNDTLDSLHAKHTFSVLIHGDARGADRMAGEWAMSKNIPVTAIPANWAAHGKAAGLIRNSQMLREQPDLVVAFPGGLGTGDMVRKAKKAGLSVIFARTNDRE